MNYELTGPIGIFDSGYGGLTILHEIRQLLPQYDYLYLGDNARAPYGPRSFEVVYEFTRQAVFKLFSMGCPLVILACNTASAKALRSIQQNDLPLLDQGLTASNLNTPRGQKSRMPEQAPPSPNTQESRLLPGGFHPPFPPPSKRVLGIIRPTAEIIGGLTQSRHVGILATEGTIKSQSYQLEIQKFAPDVTVSGVACPFWVPLVEYNEMDSPGADYFVKKRIDQLLMTDSEIDTIILGCTHYPLLLNKILKYVPRGVKVIAQGEYVANSLADYLRRHPEMEQRCSKGASCRYLTTENAEKFKESALIFLHEHIDVQTIELEQARCSHD